MGKDLNVAPNVQSPDLHPKHFASLFEARSALEMVLNQLTIYFLDMEVCMRAVGSPRGACDPTLVSLSIVYCVGTQQSEQGVRILVCRPECCF